MHRIIFYYQTFTSLKPILKIDTVVTHIHLSSIHFGISNNKPYIHLNDNIPNDPIFNNMWEDIKKADNLGIKIILMIGGAGGAFNTLFSNFDVYYNLLKTTINNYKCIKGIDLDVEEPVTLENMIKLINQIKTDFGSDFIISMAPVSFAMESDHVGLGNFIYKDLYNKVGDKIDYFNCQFYYDFAENSYDKVIQNGYPSSKIVMGMTSDENISTTKKIVSNLSKKYEFGGVFDWEYFNAPPDKEKNPYEWAIEMNKSMNQSINKSNKSSSFFDLYQQMLCYFKY